jgi:hypothetical protein
MGERHNVVHNRYCLNIKEEKHEVKIPFQGLNEVLVFGCISIKSLETQSCKVLEEKYIDITVFKNE